MKMVAGKGARAPFLALTPVHPPQPCTQSEQREIANQTSNAGGFFISPKTAAVNVQAYEPRNTQDDGENHQYAIEDE